MSTAAVFDGPGVGLEVIQDGVQGEFTFTHRDQETFDSRVVSLVQGIGRQCQTQLVLDLPASEFFVSTEHIGFGAVSEAELMHVRHLSVGDEANHGILRNKVDRLLK